MKVEFVVLEAEEAASSWLVHLVAALLNFQAFAKGQASELGSPAPGAPGLTGSSKIPPSTCCHSQE